ncbi:MAG: hypothetical protein ACP5GS_08630, partial [Nitrososphaeria archaeon]
LGKIIRRTLGMHRHPSVSVFLMITFIALTIPITYLTSNFYLLIILRTVQGTSTFLMEIFSIEYSKILDFEKRVIPSTISIGGIPTGVALGSFLVRYISVKNLFLLDLAIVFTGTIFSLLMNYIKNENRVEQMTKIKTGHNFKNPLTWFMGLIWMSIAGFNLSLAVILPLYLARKNPELIISAMNVFGYSAAIFTFVGGILAYFIYERIKKESAAFLIPVGAYIFTALGFLIIIFSGTLYLLEAILLINFEAMCIGIIYSIPRELFGDLNYANATWEFSFIGSTGHIIVPLLLIPLAYLLGFRYIFIIYAIYPLLVSALFLRIRSYVYK